MTGLLLLPSSLFIVSPGRVLRAPPPIAYSSLPHLALRLLADIGYRCSVPRRLEDDREE